MTRARLLYVEDSAIVGRFLVDALKIENIDVTLAANAEAALQSLAQDGASFDLVLCDYRLPDTTGLDLMAAIRARCPELPLVLTTGFADSDIEDAAAGFDGLLSKPFEIADIVALLERHRD